MPREYTLAAVHVARCLRDLIEYLIAALGRPVRIDRGRLFRVRQEAARGRAAGLRAGADGLSVFHRQLGAARRRRHRADGDSVLRQDVSGAKRPNSFAVAIQEFARSLDMLIDPQRPVVLLASSRWTLPNSAVLLMDLQKDFLDVEEGRMPVDRQGAQAVLDTANEVLSKRVLAEALPILVMNQFPAAQRIANFFRKGAAIAGSAGSELDGRLESHGQTKVVAKASPSAFSNPELQQYLRAQDVQELYVLGVFAEGCVRSTVLDAMKLGYAVHVIADAVATNASWKKRFALWSMKRAGAGIIPTLLAATPSLVTSQATPPHLGASQ